MNNSAIKWIGQSYERGDNTFSNCEFNIKPPFRANRSGQYTIQFDECSFYDNSATLEADDWYELFFYTTTRKDIEFRLRFELIFPIYNYHDTPNKNYIVWLFNYSNSELNAGVKQVQIYPSSSKTFSRDYVNITLYCKNRDETFINQVNTDFDNGTITEADKNDYLRENVKYYWTYTSGRYAKTNINPSALITNIELLQQNEIIRITTADNFVQHMILSVNFKEEIDSDVSYTGDDYVNYKVPINTPCLNFCDRFCYVVNNLTFGLECENPDVFYTSTGTETNNNSSNNYVRYFHFYNLRLGGPYLYIIKVNADTEEKTLNDNNQQFNVVACSQNASTYHNEPVCINSSMKIKSNDLTRFRIELLDDQFNHINLHHPVSYTLSIYNEDEY